MIIKINHKKPEQKSIDTAVKILKNGGIIIYPTDTKYGLGCDINNKKAVERIYLLKHGKRHQKPLAFLCSNFKQISLYAVVTNYAFNIIKNLAPGPFTFILRASTKAPRTVIEKKKKTVGIRLPKSPICLQIIENLGSPIFNASLNNNTEEEFSNPTQIAKDWENKVDLILDGGRLPEEQSTILDLSMEKMDILRQGKGILKI